MATQTERLRLLYRQIEDVCQHFNNIRREAGGIAESGTMPDAALHLNDVLQSTEDAATTIIDAASLISASAGIDAVPQEIRDQISDQVNRIFEASSFQDISGQRIKKVLEHLSELEAQLQRLSDAARGAQPAAKPKDPYLNGPQLAKDMPSQADIDKLFGL